MKKKGSLDTTPTLVFDEGHVYDMPPHFYWSTPKRSQGNVSALKNISKSCLALNKHGDVLHELYSLLDDL